MDWLDLLPVQGTLKSLLQHHSLKVSILQCSDCFMVHHIHTWLLEKPFSSVNQSCSTLCNPMNPSMPGLPVYHQLLEFIQTHVHRVGDSIQSSHPLLSPSAPAPNPSQHQALFQWVNSVCEVAKVLEFQLQHQSFQWIFRTDWSPLGWTSWISLLSLGISRVFSSTTGQNHQSLSSLPSLWSSSHICMWLLKKPYLWLYGPFSAKWCLYFLIHCLGLS